MSIKGFAIFGLIAGALIMTPYAEAAKKPVTTKTLAQVCPSIRSLSKKEIFKSKASGHIKDGRKCCDSFIVRNPSPAPRVSCIEGYDSEGTLIHKLGRYSLNNPRGPYSGRFYGGGGCGSRKSPSRVAALAKKNTGNTQMYLKISSTQCILIPKANGCYNSTGC